MNQSTECFFSSLLHFLIMGWSVLRDAVDDKLIADYDSNHVPSRMKRKCQGELKCRFNISEGESCCSACRVYGGGWVWDGRDCQARLSQGWGWGRGWEQGWGQRWGQFLWCFRSRQISLPDVLFCCTKLLPLLFEVFSEYNLVFPASYLPYIN